MTAVALKVLWVESAKQETALDVQTNMCKPVLAGGCPVSPHDAAVAANQVSYPKGLSTCLHPSCPAAFLVLALGHTCAGRSDLLHARQMVEDDCWRQPLVCSQIGFRDYMQGTVSQ